MALPVVVVYGVYAGSAAVAGYGGYRLYANRRDRRAAARKYRQEQSRSYRTKVKVTQSYKDLDRAIARLGAARTNFVEEFLPQLSGALDYIGSSDHARERRQIDAILIANREGNRYLKAAMSDAGLSTGKTALYTLSALGGAGFAATLFKAKASTGKAISTLTGAAKAKSALAWFGGGSKAAGGLGTGAGALTIAAPILAAGILLYARRDTARTRHYVNSVGRGRNRYIARTAELLNILHQNELVIDRFNTQADLTRAMHKTMAKTFTHEWLSNPKNHKNALLAIRTILELANIQNVGAKGHLLTRPISTKPFATALSSLASPQSGAA